MGQIEKQQQFYLSKEERESTSAIIITNIHDAENLGLDRILTSDNETTMNQLLVIFNKMYDSKLQKMTRRRLCVTIKLFSVNQLAYSLFRLFTAKKIEAMKQVACVKNVFFLLQ